MYQYPGCKFRRRTKWMKEIFDRCKILKQQKKNHIKNT